MRFYQMHKKSVITEQEFPSQATMPATKTTRYTCIHIARLRIIRAQLSHFLIAPMNPQWPFS